MTPQNERMKLGERLVVAWGVVVATATCGVLVATSDNGSNESAAVRKRIHTGLGWSQFLEVLEGYPKTLFACTSPAKATVPPCPEVRVTSRGDWLASHSFVVRFDSSGRVVAVTESQYDDW